MRVIRVHTLRREFAEGRSEGSRFLAADPWDAVLVDEAHHLHADECTGETLSFQLLRAMEERHKIRSPLLFTSTPHREKDFGFLSLLSLLDPDQRETGNNEFPCVPPASAGSNRLRLIDRFPCNLTATRNLQTGVRK